MQFMLFGVYDFAESFILKRAKSQIFVIFKDALHKIFRNVVSKKLIDLALYAET